MNRQQKSAVIDSLRHDFDANHGSFLISYQGMSVDQMQSLRKKLRSHGGKLQVAKARLMRIAAENNEQTAGLLPYFKQQIALVFAPQDTAAVAKVLLDTTKENDKLKVIAICLEQRVFGKEGLAFVAALSSRELLLAQVAHVIKAPSARFVQTLNQLIVRLLLVLKAIAEQKQQ